MLGGELAGALLAVEDPAAAELDHRVIGSQGCGRVSVRR
jgi:hypothetical protein